MQPPRLLTNLTLLLALFSLSSFANAIDDIFKSDKGSSLEAESFGEFNQPWAMTFLSDENLLVTEKAGKLLLVNLKNGFKKRSLNMPKSYIHCQYISNDRCF